MAKCIIVLGNGFDLDLGLATSYSSFVKSKQWSDLMESSINSWDNEGLLGFLRSKSLIEKWIDIEAALLEFARIKTSKHDISNANADRFDFIELCKALKSYLLEQQTGFNGTKKSVAALLLKIFSRLTEGSRIYTFNYTEPRVLAKAFNWEMNHRVSHIHGSLNDDDGIILGIETNEIIDDHYAFLYKTQNRRYRHTNIMKDLWNKNEYVFFGHALNGMDYAYFKNTFSILASSSAGAVSPRLTIITKSAEDEESFKVFLRKQMVSLQALYSNTDPTFILTDEVYNGNEEEKDKVVKLVNRIEMM